jgi:hypothetical protein
MLVEAAEGHAPVAGLTRNAAAGALAQRLVQAALTLLAPWLALALAIPPRRAPSGMGLGVGTLLLAGAMEAGNALAASAPAEAALLAGFTMLIGCLSLWQRRTGYDAVERQLNAITLRLRRRPASRESEPVPVRHPLAPRLDMAA